MKLTNQFYDFLKDTLVHAFRPLSNVNCGGCGWAALVMAKALRRNGIPCEVYFKKYVYIEFLYDDYGNNFIDACNQCINEGNGERVPNQHILIKVGEHFFDSDGYYDPDEVDLTTRTPLPLLKLMLKHADWNDHFEYSNRKNPVTKEDVEANLNKQINQLTYRLKL